MSLREAAEKALNWIEWRDANIHEWFREGISVNETLRNALAEAEKDESAEAVTAERDALRSRLNFDNVKEWASFFQSTQD